MIHAQQLPIMLQGQVLNKHTLEIPHHQSMYCTPSPVHQTFGQSSESASTTSHKWMTNLFGVDLNAPNSLASYLASLQQFNAPHSFGEQGQSSSATTTHTKYTDIEQHHHDVGELVIQERSTPQRNRRLPPYGTSHHLGH